MVKYMTKIYGQWQEFKSLEDCILAENLMLNWWFNDSYVSVGGL